jgi:SAM-dependent methyltransferase
METFNWANVKIDRALMDHRLLSTISAIGWQQTIVRILNLEIPFTDLRVIEVGSGSGTFALSLCLLGAQVTLVDADKQALATAHKAFDLYNQKAGYVAADVLGPVPEQLRSQFHCAVSGGLAEHFTGTDRLKCMQFHKELLCPGGFARIGVPNRLSPFYQMVRLFRIATKTWGLDVEIPYTISELTMIAKQAGFIKSKVIGNFTLIKDAREYSAGLVSAMLLVSPGLRKMLHRSKRKEETGSDHIQAVTIDINARLQKAVEQAKSLRNKRSRWAPKDTFSAGLVLYGER